jgi:pantoate--beta-alanine ligase
MMEVEKRPSAMRSLVRAARTRGETVTFVPTMGAFHEGHLSLVRAARGAGDLLAVSIYVNPLQFGPSEDLEAYPRNLERDLDLARAEGADVVFAPSVEEMQPAGRSTRVNVGRLAEILEGASRPGHFDGVCTVVAQLLNVVAPDVAFFGQKDAQQVAAVRRMVQDLFFDVEVRVCATVRDADGLALSSRNAYLGEHERRRASVLFRALNAGRKEWLSSGDVAITEKRMRGLVEAQGGVSLDYARVVDPITFERPEPTRAPLLLIAARV